MNDSILRTAVRAARAGGEICRKYFEAEIAVDNKQIANLVTAADYESEIAIVEVIRQAFPDHAILAEEKQKADISSNRLWVVDPLDGTNNFAHFVPHFAVSVGYWVDGVPVAGVIYNPVRDELYTAQKGMGAFAGERRLSVSKEVSMEQSLIGCGFYYDRGGMMRATLRAVEACFEKNIHGIRRFGTASLDLIQVATGRYGGFFEYKLAPWDFAAGKLFVEEAGGRVTTCSGEELDLGQSTVLATNGLLHDELLDIVQRFLPSGEVADI